MKRFIRWRERLDRLTASICESNDALYCNAACNHLPAAAAAAAATATAVTPGVLTYERVEELHHRQHHESGSAECRTHHILSDTKQQLITTPVLLIHRFDIGVYSQAFVLEGHSS